MLRNYIKIAWRNIWRNKAFSLTNLLGLTIGMSCTLLILLWVQDELSWDKFHPNHKEVYHIMANREFNGEVNTDIATPFPLSDALRQNFPEIRNTAMDDYGGDHVIKLGDKLVKKNAVILPTRIISKFSGGLSSKGMLQRLSRDLKIW